MGNGKERMGIKKLSEKKMKKKFVDIEKRLIERLFYLRIEHLSNTLRTKFQ
jgi:hypothetical protein